MNHPAISRFKGYRLFAAVEASQDQRPNGRVVDLSLSDLSPGEVVVRVLYCALNYKAALANAGRHRLIRSYPRIGGAEIIGRVEASSDPRFNPGDLVQNGGHSVGIDHDGGFAQFARLRADWLLRLPPEADPFEAAAIGGNGLCVAYAIHRMEQNGLSPDAGPVLVTGGTGGLATLAIQMLACLGYRVSVLTGKPSSGDMLRGIGASEVLDEASLVKGRRPLESGRWAGAIDSVGGETLAWLTRTMLPGGTIASVGNVGGPELDTTLMPFILRGVTLIGIAAYPLHLREQFWARIRKDMRPIHLRECTKVIGLHDLAATLDAMLARRTMGRTLLRPDLT
ncbi:MAG: acryloyl-CoA reductase [Chromatiales bacterium]|jgi:acrylyl-CoA reductase (NADPH)|nr:acryloyl-CoA reductase [Chromatiales bacterium]